MVTVHIGVDIGGTKTDAVVTDAAGQVAGRARIPSRQGPAGVVATAVAAVSEATAQADVDVAAAASVGVGVPGMVRGGVVSHALNLGVESLDLGAALASEWGRDVTIENDVNAAALGAWVLAGSAPDSVAFLNVGTGLAAGLILDGRLWRGARGGAGEVGHLSIDPDGPLDADGEPGTIETYASGSGILRQTGGVAAADALDDPRFAHVRDGLFRGVAAAVRSLVLTVDVERVLIGGGLTAMGEPLLDGVRGVFTDWGGRSAFLASLELGERVSIVPPAQPYAAVGAAMVGAGRG